LRRAGSFCHLSNSKTFDAVLVGQQNLPVVERQRQTRSRSSWLVIRDDMDVIGAQHFIQILNVPP